MLLLSRGKNHSYCCSKLSGLKYTGMHPAVSASNVDRRVLLSPTGSRQKRDDSMTAVTRFGSMHADILSLRMPVEASDWAKPSSLSVAQSWSTQRGSALHWSNSTSLSRPCGESLLRLPPTKEYRYGRSCALTCASQPSSSAWEAGWKDVGLGTDTMRFGRSW